MNTNRYLEKFIRLLLIRFYLFISDKGIADLKKLLKTCNFISPVIFKGAGKVSIAKNVTFGVANDPKSFTCSYVEARNKDSEIVIGQGSILNNQLALISEGPGISIGERNLIGQNCTIMDSNFHNLDIKRRMQPDQKPLRVIIHNDVFIGANVTILKGVEIGSGSVIGAGSVLPVRFKAPINSTVMGNPAKVIKQT